ncbi:MAG: ThiF family adenylyltransferase [Synergistaceae bacterium]|jgi:integrative and conjugative element protein (TIGR02256 family)|nr:ThiF family adenylyltransferase [Synergistaceae bacterium]
MKMPYRNDTRRDGYGKGERSGDYSGRRQGARGNPFDGASEADIVTLTERVLNDDRNIGYVTSDGRVMPRNDAFASGCKDGLELIKERVWGGELGMLEETEASRETEADSPPIELIFSEEAKEAICRESLAVSDVETGGALIGNWERETDGTLIIHVERASGPGADATRQPALFSPALGYYRARVNYYRETRGWEYVGEWHKHPGNFGSLSATDIDTAKSLIHDEGWPLLLLPIVTRKDGCFFVDNYVVLSRQLGTEGVFYAGGFELNFLRHNSSEIRVYIDEELIRSFRAASEKSAEVLGMCNSGESYVFVPSPGQKNARLRLVRAEKEVPFTDSSDCVTAIVDDAEVRCYHVNEGEILSLPYALIDPEVSIYERNAGLVETSVLRDKTVTLVGCGSLGSAMALALARAGVGTFHLFDYDILSPANIARHQGDLRDLGRNKASVVCERIRYINPALSVDVHPCNVVEDTEGLSFLEDFAAESDLLICTTDTDDSRMLVNSLAVRLKVKSLQAGLHERAASGIVHLYDPEEEQACFACHRRRILSESGKRAEGVAYSEARDIRDLTVQPGLSAQIDLVAQTGALRAIEALTGASSLPPLSIVYVDKKAEETRNGNTAPGGQEEEGEFAENSLRGNLSARRLQLRIAHLDLERLKDCPVCGFHAESETREYDSGKDWSSYDEEKHERSDV